MSQVKNTDKGLGKTFYRTILLKSIAFLGFFSPNCGSWIKRLIFVLSVYTELRKHHLYENLTLDNLNEKVLKVRDKSVLTTAVSLTRFNLGQFQLEDVYTTLQKSGITIPEAELIGNKLAEQAPTDLDYGRSAMARDVVRMLTT